MKTVSPHRYQLVAALAVAGVLLAAGGWLLLVGPQRQHAASAAGQVQQTKDQVAQLITAARTAETKPSKPPTFQTKALYRLETAMPVTEDEPDLLLGLDQLAGSYGVEVASLSPGTPAAAVGYTVVPVALTLNGTYASLTHFLRRLRTLVGLRHGEVVASGRLFAVTSVTVAPAGTGNKLRATVALQAFVYGAVAGATPLPSTSGTTGSTSTNSTTASGK